MRKRHPRIRSRRDFLLAHSPDRRLRILYRVRHWVGWLLVIVTVLFLVLNLQLLTPASIKSIRSSLKAASSGTGSDTTLITYPSSTIDAAAPFGNALAVCSNGEMSIELPGSYTQMTENMAYADPAMRSSDRYLLTFDRGANRYTVSNNMAAIYNKTMANEITTADIADNGNVVVVTGESGYKCGVYVYDIDSMTDAQARGTESKPIYHWSSGEYYIMSAAISRDGSHIALFGFNQKGLKLDTRLFDINIKSDAKPTKDDGIDMNGSLCAGLTFIGRSAVCAVCDNAAYVTGPKRIRYQTDYSSGDLLSFDMSDGSNVALCTTSYSQEGRAEVTLLNARGTTTRAPLILEAAPDSISVCDGRLAVLSGDTIAFYNRSLRQIDSQTGFSGVSNIYMRSGNLCIARYASYARVLTIGRPLDNLNEDETVTEEET